MSQKSDSENKVVLCIIFRKLGNSYQFLLLRRIPSRGGFWQPVGGTVEEKDRTLLDTCYREVFEETGIAQRQIIRVIENFFHYSYDTHYLTGEPTETTEENVFAFEISGNPKINIKNNFCQEHDDFRWVSFDEALSLLKWQDNKDAFMKLREILML